MSRACFVTWFSHRRTIELCRALDLELVEIVSRKRGVRRYLELIPRTVRMLRSRRPRVVIAQSPSIVLAALVLLLRPWLGHRALIDAHNEAVEPFLNPSAFIRCLTYWMLRSADRVIVTNTPLARDVERHGGRPLVLPDPLTISTPADRVTDGHFRVAVIATYAGDEPVAEIFAAANALGDTYRFFVTGNPAKLAEPLRQAMPTNITLTGFLPEKEYWHLLSTSDAVLDLTTMDNCLVCGAYEAISVGVPVVLSDNEASVATFADFAEFTTNEARDIEAALRRVRSRNAQIRAGMPAAHARFVQRWTAQSRELTSFISAATAPR